MRCGNSASPPARFLRQKFFCNGVIILSCKYLAPFLQYIDLEQAEWHDRLVSAPKGMSELEKKGLLQRWHNLIAILFPRSCALGVSPPSSICPSPRRCQAASWPRSPSAGTSACSPWCCGSPAMLRWSPNPSVASRRTILPSLPCARSLEVGGGVGASVWRVEMRLVLLYVLQ